MNLDELRQQINTVDDKILQLFIERMKLVDGVALYKKQNKIPILHQDREQQILDRITNNSPEKYKNAANVFFQTIMDISKSSQERDISQICEITKKIVDAKQFEKTQKLKVGCQGIKGAYSHLASIELYPNAEYIFYNTFENVFDAVQNGEVDFGVLPQQNSTAGGVNSVYALLSKYNLFINDCYNLKINHCLATRFDVNSVIEVISHEMAINQCNKFLQKNNYNYSSRLNTAIAAYEVASSNKNIGAICSEKSAELYGLKVIEKCIQDSDDNYTKFISISNSIYKNPSANTVTISLLLPHISGSLYRLLTKFSVFGINLTKIESSPIGNKNFDVIFYISFEGNIESQNVVDLINDLSMQMSDFKFLGNFKD